MVKITFGNMCIEGASEHEILTGLRACKKFQENGHAESQVVDSDSTPKPPVYAESNQAILNSITLEQWQHAIKVATWAATLPTNPEHSVPYHEFCKKYGFSDVAGRVYFSDCKLCLEALNLKFHDVIVNVAPYCWRQGPRAAGAIILLSAQLSRVEKRNNIGKIIESTGRVPAAVKRVARPKVKATVKQLTQGLTFLQWLHDNTSDYSQLLHDSKTRTIDFVHQTFGPDASFHIAGNIIKNMYLALKTVRIDATKVCKSIKVDFYPTLEWRRGPEIDYAISEIKALISAMELKEKKKTKKTKKINTVSNTVSGNLNLKIPSGLSLRDLQFEYDNCQKVIDLLSWVNDIGIGNTKPVIDFVKLHGLSGTTSLGGYSRLTQRFAKRAKIDADTVYITTRVDGKSYWSPGANTSTLLNYAGNYFNTIRLQINK